MFRPTVFVAILLWLVPLGRAAVLPDVLPAPADTLEATSPTLKIVHMHLSGELVETPVNDPFNLMGDESLPLKTLIERLESARKDKAVGAVMITLDSLAAGIGQIDELHRELLRVRDAKKPVYVHVDVLDNRSYLLASAADEISLVPTSLVLVVGLNAESLYVKDLLDKIGVSADFVKCGKYKSAMEMLTRNAPSPEAAENMNWLLDGLYKNFVDQIARGRKTTPEKVRAMIDGGPYGARQALKARLVDRLEQRNEFIARVKDKLGPNTIVDNRYAAKKDSLNVDVDSPFAVLSLFKKMSTPPPVSTRAAVGVIYVDGTILDGYKSQNPFDSDGNAYAGDIRFAFEKAARDNAIKAIVMRIDSPGGSAIASEVILNAARQAHAKKPLVVSMGNVAASGGYFVAMAGDEIYADSNTLTGSIGVFSGKLVTAQMWDKIGFKWVPYRRGKNAGIMSANAGFSEPERAKFQAMCDEIYEQFKKHVTDCRGKKLAKPIEDLAGGRVYTGEQAAALGLVDRLGGLDAAIEAAAKRAKIERYDVRVIPEPLNPIEQFMAELGGRRERPSDVSLGAQGDAVLAVLGRLDPEHARAARRMLDAIGLLRNQEALLFMPQALVIR